MDEFFKQMILIWAAYDKTRREQNMNVMGHFNGWQFGVPVKVHGLFMGTLSTLTRANIRLIDETSSHFKTIDEHGMTTYSKGQFYYELIPYKTNTLKLRYPVCITSMETVYCNAGDEMGLMTTQIAPLKVALKPTATLIIDGKEIQLSAETAARLKKELGG